MFELQYHIITGDKAIVAVAEESWEFSFQAVRTWRGNTTGLWLSYSTLFDIFFQLRASDFDIFNLCDIISDVHTQTYSICISVPAYSGYLWNDDDDIIVTLHLSFDNFN